MVKIRWNEEALKDINEIAEYIALDSEIYATIQVEKFFDKVEVLKGGLQRGRVVPELGNKKVRELIEGNYRIVYQIKGQVAEVLCVLHGKRLLKHHPSFKK
jgi:toxin ParE1/3/4